MTTRTRLIRNLSVAAAAVVAVSAHSIALADSPAARADRAMDACVTAFVAAKLPKEQPVKVRKEAFVPSPLDTHQRNYKIVMTATGTESGKRLARGVCIIDRGGNLVAFNGKRPREQLARAEVSTTEKTAAR